MRVIPLTTTESLHRLNIPVADELSDGMKKYLQVCEEKLGFVPNVLKSLAFSDSKLRDFSSLYNDLMLAESGVSELEREMIALVVSSINRCFYCQVAHGHAVRRLSRNPALSEALIMNYRVAEITERQRAMLTFADKVTTISHQVSAEDLDSLRHHGFSDRDIWDIINVVAFFNMTNRLSSALGMRPNPEYHGAYR